MNKAQVCLIAINLNNDLNFNHRLQECAELIEAADFELVSYLTQSTQDEMAYYLGTGKIEELKEIIEKDEIDFVVTLDELSPAQHRNLEEILNLQVFDRTQLILMIFANRAFSKEAKLQVESARLSYLLPRLKTHRTHTGRQQGGGARTRGAGEKLLDLRRRTALKQFQQIQRELKKSEHTHDVQAQARRKSNALVVAFVGYTNVGKSSLMNAILEKLSHNQQKNVEANDRLFETLGTASRHCVLNKKNIILTDTVGFVSQLPHSLIKAFHSTLDEVREADLLIHVIDASNEHAFNQQMVTLETLKELEVDNKPIITVYNKGDISDHPGLCVSARTGQNIDELIQVIDNECQKIQHHTQILIPYDSIHVLNDLKKMISHPQIRESETGFLVTIPFALSEESEWFKYQI